MDSETSHDSAATGERTGPRFVRTTLSDAEMPWLQHAVVVLTVSVAVGCGIVLLSSALAGTYYVFFLLAAELGVLVPVHLMNRRGASRLAAQVLALSLPLLATGLLAFGGGFRGTPILVYPACLIVAGLLLDRRTLAILAAETIICLGLVIAGEGLGFLAGRPPYEPFVQDLVDVTVIVTVTAVGVGLVADQLRAALVQARESAAALQAANERLEEQAARLNQARKMELIGRLAGGVAHDFNNLLSVITGHLTLLRRHLADDPRADRWLKEADDAAWRAAEITRELLSFAQQRELQREVTDLRDIVETMRPRLRKLAGEDVTVEVEVPTAPCRARVDRGQIERVVASLAANGRDAMNHRGVLRVAVSRAGGGDLDGYLALSVSDTGAGMSEEVRQRLFEPFFTTKLPGSTAGLSLALIYTVVEQHGGWIDVESEPNRGSTFTVHLPEAGPVGRPAAPNGDVEVRA